MPVLTTLAKLKTHLGITDSSEDDTLEQMLNQIDEAVASATGRGRVAGYHPFVSVEGTEYLDGTGQPELYLHRRPVTAIDSVRVDPTGYFGHGANAFAASTEWTLGTDWVPTRLDKSEENASCLIALKATGWSDPPAAWPEGRGNIKVVYTAGYGVEQSDDYSGIPADLELAAHLLASELRQSAAQGVGGPIKSETLGRYSYDLLTDGDMPVSAGITQARGIVARYREIHV